MPPKKGEQPRGGNEQRRTAESSTANTWSSSNVATQPTIPPPIPAQNSAPQSSSVASQSNTQRRGQQPEQRTNPPPSSAAGRSNVNPPPRSPWAPPTQTRGPLHHNSTMGIQDNTQRHGQQPEPRNNPPIPRAGTRNNMNQPQRSGEAPPTQPQSSSRHNSIVGNQNNAPRPDQQPVPTITGLTYGQIARNNLSPPQNPSEARPAQAQNSVRQNTNTANQNSAQRPSQRQEPRSNSGSHSTVGRNRPSRGSASNPANPSEDANTPENACLPEIYGGRNGTPPEPNKDVTEAENNFIKQKNVSTEQGSEFCLRPGYGSLGNSTSLWTNYLELYLQSKDLDLYSYNMVIEPEIKKKPPHLDDKPEGDKKTIPKGEKRRQIIKVFLDDSVFKAKRPGPIATDFNSTLITRHELDLGTGKAEDQEGKFTVEYRAEGFTSAPPEKYSIRVKKNVSLSVSDFQDYLNPTVATSDYNKSLIQESFNVILGHYTKKSDKLARVGSRKIFPFDPELSKTELGNGLVALRGYFTGAIGATSRILVNVNISHGAFYNDIPLKSLIEEYRRRGAGTFELHRFLKRLRIRTTHLSANDKAFGKIRTISGLAMKGDGTNLLRLPHIATNDALGGDPYQVSFYKDPSANFSIQPSFVDSGSAGASRSRQKSELPWVEQKRYTSVSGFFKTTYPGAQEAQNLARNIPVVNVGTRSIPIYLPAEVCVVLPGQTSRSKLNSHQTRNMIAFAKCDPGFCAQKIAGEGRKTLGYDQTYGPMVEFDMQTSRDLITVPSRVLTKPEIEYNTGSFTPKNGSWNLDGLKLQEPVSITRYYFLHIALGGPRNNLPSDGVEQRVKTFDQMMTQCGIHHPRSYQLNKVTFRKDAVVSELEEWLDNFLKDKTTSGSPTQSSSGPKPDTRESEAKTVPEPPLLVIILPNNSDEPYNTIKTYADRKLGFHTVCVTGERGRETWQDKKFYAERPMQYMANVILKINLKLGGTNHKLAQNSTHKLISNGTTMIVGIDVTHPSHGSKEDAPSIFAVVASMDPPLSQWPVRFGVQSKSREEVISNRPKLIEMFDELLKLWQASNGVYPQNILVYRDGVSEGQYSAVIKQELAALREACNQLYVKHPRISLIVVAKRHHTRFYPTKIRQADSTNNAECGTVVDRGITQAQTWDFFLQSHSVIKGGKERIGEIQVQKPSGTARPAHYVVLHDEIFESFPKENRADQLQEITHNMCYLYGPATKAISICPPVYLADKACTRARLYLNDAFGPPTQDEIDKRKDKKDEKDETPDEKKQREDEEKQKIKSYQDRIKVHENLKNTMFYI